MDLLERFELVEDMIKVKVSNGETLWVCDKSRGEVRDGDLSEVDNRFLIMQAWSGVNWRKAIKSI